MGKNLKFYSPVTVYIEQATILMPSDLTGIEPPELVDLEIEIVQQKKEKVDILSITLTLSLLFSKLNFIC